MTWWRYAHGALLSAALLSGCADGGQTGQPTAASCGEPVALGVAIGGVSGQQLIHAFVGSYSATLHWQGPAGVPPDEALTLDITPATNGVAKEGISYACYRSLTVPVAASLTLADGSEVSSGSATLSAPYGSFDATLSFGSKPWLVSAKLSRGADGVHIAGELKPDATDAEDASSGLSGVFSGDRTTGGDQ